MFRYRLCHLKKPTNVIAIKQFQIRLDFDTFVISGPSTSVATASTQNLHLNGIASIGAGKKNADVTRCATDTFSITNQNTVPLICGTNSGVHGN